MAMSSAKASMMIVSITYRTVMSTCVCQTSVNQVNELELET
jgi:hypothetical protein